MAARTLDPHAWRGYRQDDFPHASWSADGEVLRALEDGPRVDLVSRERFRDFVLTFQWLLPAAGNSGVMYRVSEERAHAWESGPEVQLVDDERHPDGGDPLTACGALYGLLAPTTRTGALPGVFRRGRLSVRGTAVEHWLDGQRVLVYDLEDAGLRERIAGSKFRDSPDFARWPEGHIVLQHHGTAAAFRDLHIEPL